MRRVGAFDDLPYRGERIPIDDDDSEWALAHHVLRQAGVASLWIETDREIRDLLRRCDELLERAASSSADGLRRDRAELTRLVDAVNRLVFRLNYDAPTPRQHRRPLDLDVKLARLERTRTR